MSTVSAKVKAEEEARALKKVAEAARTAAQEAVRTAAGGAGQAEAAALTSPGEAARGRALAKDATKVRAEKRAAQLKALKELRSVGGITAKEFAESVEHVKKSTDVPAKAYEYLAQVKRSMMHHAFS